MARRVTRQRVQALVEKPTSARVTRQRIQALVEKPTSARVTRQRLQILVSYLLELDGQSTGEAQVEGTLLSAVPGIMESFIFPESEVSGELTAVPRISAIGRGYVALANLDNGFNELTVEIAGEATVEGDFYQIIEVPYQPVNYPFARGVAGVLELSATIFGVGGVQGQADIPVVGGSSGTSTTTGSGSQIGNLGTATSTGEGYITAELFVGGGLGELEAEIFGDAEAYVLGTVVGNDDEDFFANPDSFYYIYGNVITGFNPTDDVDGSDGDIVRAFARNLHLYTNINVGFDYTDDVSDYVGFVSQSYPDGDIIRDFARSKYQYLLVIPEVTPPFHRLTIGPAPRSPEDLTPTERPPRKRNR